MNSDKTGKKPRFQLGTSGILVGISILFSFATLVQASVVARALGLGRAYDVYLCGFALPELAIFLLGNLLQASLIPIFYEARQAGGEERGWEALSSLINICALMCLGVFLLCILFPGVFAAISSPGMSPSERGEVATLFVPLAGVAVVSGFQKATINLHKIYDSFIWPAVTGLLQPAAMITSVLLWAPSRGVWALVWGLYAGTFAQGIALFIIFLPRILAHYRFRLALKDPIVKKGLYLGLSVFIGAGASRGVIVIDRAVASMLGPGDIGALKYSLQMVLIAVSIAGMPFVTVMYPDFCRRFAAGDMTGAIENIDWALKILALVMLPIMAITLVLGKEIVQALFQRGAFMPADTERTVLALNLLAPSIFLISLYHLFGGALIGMGKSGWFSAVGALMLVITFGADTLLMKIWGLSGIAAAKTIVQLTWAVTLAVIAKRYLGSVLSRGFLLFLGACGIAACGAAAASGLVNHSLYSMNLWVRLIAGATTGTVVFAALIMSFGGKMVIDLLKQASRKVDS